MATKKYLIFQWCLVQPQTRKYTFYWIELEGGGQLKYIEKDFETQLQVFMAFGRAPLAQFPDFGRAPNYF